ncbi:MFS transporter [Nitrogeniibacter mangrovi]|uniref:MFS transporter n=1 Tax=Nitrogeniibacter mangrovi TaxID=2016596 RepID=A0A6C1B133_9RHOO|nr:MFS transporter [Nitrogeniibacter mangrovi]QID16699.1 MFS transporter [Nitrogeniibacter mangrovi]
MPPRDDRLFAHRGYIHFWLGRICSTSANQMLAVAVAWQVWDLTRSAFALGLVGLLLFLPKLVFMPLAGNLADRLDRRRLIASAQLAQALCLAALTLATASGWISLPLIYALMVLSGTARTFEMPTTQAFVPLLVPTPLLARAVAMGASAHQVSTIVAPALAGFIYVAGAQVVYAIATALVVTASVLLTRATPVRAQVFGQRGASGWHTFVLGLRFIRDQRAVLGAISLDMMAVLLGGATALLPIIASEVLHTGPWGLGLLRSAPALGALAMSVWLAHHPLSGRVGPRMFGAVALFGVATIVFGLSSQLWLSMGALAVLGAADMVSMVFRGAYIQLATPDAMRGRVGAVNSLFIGASNQLGEFESGVTAAWFGAVPAIVLGGVGTLLVVVLWMRWFPDLARLDRLPEAEPPMG